MWRCCGHSVTSSRRRSSDLSIWTRPDASVARGWNGVLKGRVVAQVGEGKAVDHGHGVSFREAFRVWLRVATLSFGGPAGQIAVMHKILVEEKRWVSENRFLHALNYCMLLPGPEAQQLATYIGWLMHGTA